MYLEKTRVNFSMPSLRPRKLSLLTRQEQTKSLLLNGMLYVSFIAIIWAICSLQYTCLWLLPALCVPPWMTKFCISISGLLFHRKKAISHLLLEGIGITADVRSLVHIRITQIEYRSLTLTAFSCICNIVIHIASSFSDHRNHWKLQSFDVTFQKRQFACI